MHRNRICLLVGLLILAACDGGGPGFTPFLMFTYAGATAGSFNAAGQPPTTEAATHAWAGAVRDTEENTVTVLGVTANTANLAGLSFPDGATGALNFSATCDPGTQQCASFGLILGLSDNSSAGFFCDLTSGSVTITTHTSTRVAGTFSGTGSCTNGGGADAGTLTVTAGSFEATFVSSTQAPQ